MVFRVFTLLMLVLSATNAVTAETTIAAGQETFAAPSTITGRFMLVNHFGEAVSNADYRGKFLLISFGYTYCPDVCPTTLSTMSRALKLLGDTSAHIQPLFVSVDPERDTPKVLREYLAYFHPDIIGLTGTPELVQRASANFNVTYAKVSDPGRDPGLYAMDHSAGIFLMAPDGTFVAKFAHTLEAEALAARLGPILHGD